MDKKIKREWGRMDLETKLKLEKTSVLHIIMNVMNQIESEFYKILIENFGSNHSNNDHKEIELLDPNLNIKETLKNISTSVSLRYNFENNLKKNYNIENWFFWLDLTKLIEDEKTEEELFTKMKEISQKYLTNVSYDEVKVFDFILLFLFSPRLQ